MNKAAWINLCSLRMQAMCPRARPFACLVVARMLWLEEGCLGVGPYAAAMMEVRPTLALPAPEKRKRGQ